MYKSNMRCNCWLISSNYSDGGVPSIQISGFGSSLLLMKACLPSLRESTTGFPCF